MTWISPEDLSKNITVLLSANAPDSGFTGVTMSRVRTFPVNTVYLSAGCAARLFSASITTIAHPRCLQNRSTPPIKQEAGERLYPSILSPASCIQRWIIRRSVIITEMS